MLKKRIALVGNPNVGKSTIFNKLTNSFHHTGNWTGKTVSNEKASFVYDNVLYEVTDLPGVYSLIPSSLEERIATDEIINTDYDIYLFVSDATNLERSIRLLFELMDIKDNVILCVNLLNEAHNMHISIDLERLKTKTNLQVIPFYKVNDEEIQNLLLNIKNYRKPHHLKITHHKKIQNYLNFFGDKIPQEELISALFNKKDYGLEKENILNYYRHTISKIEVITSYHDYTQEFLRDIVNRSAEEEKKTDTFLNKLFTSKFSSMLVYFSLLFLVLWLTIYLSNIPSELCFKFFDILENVIYNGLSFIPKFILNPLILGGFRTMYWVISVMAPPIFIFFPLFSLLEDYGLLPRIAFSFDRPFSLCGSSGKQSLTMCMGLGCNAVGVTGSRIMESKKMRILCILTNSFMPCNGRFPILIAILKIFFVKSGSGLGTIIASLGLSICIIVGILLTLLVTKLLSVILFPSEKPFLLLEIPYFRKPNILNTIKCSFKEKGFDILKRAVVMSFPAGLILYFFMNVAVNGISLFRMIGIFLEPFGNLFGIDGTILTAFIFGIPANEIVLPVLVNGYLGNGVLSSYESLDKLREVLILNNWSIKTAICFIVMVISHYPCLTTIMTIKKETKSMFYTIMAVFIPLIIGLGLCFLINLLF